MVKIVKGKLVNVVTKSAFENFFKSQGWELAGEGNTSPVPNITEKKEEKKLDKVVDEPTIEENSDEEINDEDWDEALDELIDNEVEKPISEMNKEELIAKAKSLGINTNGLSNKQLREAIKSSK